ncbi:MAG TPA: sigma-70 family RNA polymerase sigma factor [Solirubrobacteraceae bacterium]|nr:sigma-70 family RNA polymerase sigma factor [Solirubrobacteraceae bacterium]
MDVRAQRSGKERPTESGRRSLTGLFRPRPGYGYDSEWIGQVLGEWQAQEVRAARNFPECRGLTTEQLEDIYQETTVALLRRPYQTEEHLRNALRMGLKHRALNLHRDERRRGQILARSAPGMYVMAEERGGQNAPELAALVHQDRLIVSEFLTELTEVEQCVFGWLVEGLQYRAIASVEGIDVNVARNAARSCERKRERFQLLYDTGRLCGFRSATIHALQSGEATSEQLAERAFAHLESCAHCRAEHKTNARRLRRSFQGDAAALLPPILVGRLGWITRARMLLHRFMPDGVPAGPGAVRERAAALLAGGGAAAKIAAGVATVAVIAGGTIATHVLDHAPLAQPRHSAVRVSEPPHQTLTTSIAPTPALSGRQATARAVQQKAPRNQSRRRGSSSAPGRVLASTHPTNSGQASQEREPGGFAYLGVPTTPTSPPAAQAQAASVSEDQHGGGPFSP